MRSLLCSIAILVLAAGCSDFEADSRPDQTQPFQDAEHPTVHDFNVYYGPGGNAYSEADPAMKEAADGTGGQVSAVFPPTVEPTREPPVMMPNQDDFHS